MKRFLIGSCLVGILVATTPALADSDRREDRREGFHQKVDHDRGNIHHKKFLSSRHRDSHAHHGYRDRKHGWKQKKYHQHKHGWKRGKGHHHRHDYHGHKRHWNKGRHHYRQDHGTRLRFYYNNGAYPMEYQVLQGAQLLIDVTR